MRVAVLFSGGKDSCYATWLVLHQAWDVVKLVTVKPATPDSWMFHYPNVEWTGLQARAMAIDHVTVSAGSHESLGLEEILPTLKKEGALDGLVTGAVASDYQKARFDALCEKVGLKSFSPLWHKRPEFLINDLIQAGFRIVMSGVAASGLDESWLGKELTPDDWGRLKDLSIRKGLHLSGEGGEYETFVVDAPHFRRGISIRASEKIWEGESGRLAIKDASL